MRRTSSSAAPLNGVVAQRPDQFSAAPNLGTSEADLRTPTLNVCLPGRSGLAFQRHPRAASESPRGNSTQRSDFGRRPLVNHDLRLKLYFGNTFGKIVTALLFSPCVRPTFDR